MFDEFKLSLNKSFKNWMDKFNVLLDRLESLPLPISFGSNTQMNYLKLSNGTVLMWGRVEYGKNYPCSEQWEGLGGGGWASREFTLEFPLPLVKDSPVVVPHVINSGRVETFCVSVSASYTTYTGRFWCAAPDNGGASTLNILVIGDWK